jgi:hypothetical protein
MDPPHYNNPLEGATERSELSQSLLSTHHKHNGGGGMAYPHHRHTMKDTMTKVNSKTEFPELRQASLNSRAKNSLQLHNNNNFTNTTKTTTGASHAVNSQASSRTQLAMLASSTDKGRFQKFNNNKGQNNNSNSKGINSMQGSRVGAAERQSNSPKN